MTLCKAAAIANIILIQALRVLPLVVTHNFRPVDLSTFSVYKAEEIGNATETGKEKVHTVCS